MAKKSDGKSRPLTRFINAWRGSSAGISFEILSKEDRKKTLSVCLVQIILGILDLLGVALLGLLGALSITGIQSRQPSDRISQILDFLHIGKFEFQIQVGIIAVMAVIFLIGKTILSALLVRKTLYFLSRRGATIASDLIMKLLSENLLVIQSKSVQLLIFSVTGGISAVTVGVLGAAVSMIADIALLIVLTIGLLIIDPILALVTITFFAAIGWFLYFAMHRRAQQLGQRNSSIQISSNEDLNIALNTQRELLLRDRRDYFIELISKQRHSLARIESEQAFMPNISKYFMESSVFLGALAISAVQFMRQDAVQSIATLSIFLAAGLRIAPAVLRVQQGFLGMKISSGAAKPAIELIHLLSKSKIHEVEISKLDVVHKGFNSSVKVTDLSFKYPNTEGKTLDGISFNIQPGTVTAIVGPSGAGKTTLVDCILGVLIPEEGEIVISEMKPSDAVSKWPGAIAYVPQDVFIINGTIAENIALGFSESEINDNLVRSALITSQLSDFVSQYKNGVNALAGERGSNLSGGQRQRIGIARALYTKPKLLVLDEATSSLDAETEDALSRSIHELRGDVTVIMIAHRLSIARSADQVLYLEGGYIRASGTFDEVRKAIPDFDHQAKLMGL